MPAGRPKIQIDYEQVGKLSSIFCTQSEIAAILGVSLSKLEKDKEFVRIHKNGLEAGKCSLRRKQFKLADKNAGMAIWLGKQYLGQRDPDKVFGVESSEELLAKLAEVQRIIAKDLIKRDVSDPANKPD